MTSENEEMLVEPYAASDFAIEVALQSTDSVDQSAFTIGVILDHLHLTGKDGKPNKLAIDAGLPDDNQDLVNAICNAAAAREMVEMYEDEVLNLTGTLGKINSLSANVPQISDLDSKTLSNIGEVKKVAEDMWDSAKTSRQRYVEEYNKARKLIAE